MHQTNWLYFLSLLHQTTTDVLDVRYISSCISFLFYIKPQRWAETRAYALRCISFLFYIKPQLIPKKDNAMDVVFPFSSTSNHNFCKSHHFLAFVVFPFSSTSNHNKFSEKKNLYLLYFLSLLHQTTTLDRSGHSCRSCISFLFYIKPQPFDNKGNPKECCISFLFYITPQPVASTYPA